MKDKPKNKALDAAKYRDKELERKEKMNELAEDAIAAPPPIDFGALLRRAMQHAVRQDQKKRRERRLNKTRRASRKKNRGQEA